MPDDHEAEERAVLNARILELEKQVKEYNRLLDISKSYGRKDNEDLVKWITGIMAKESFLN